MHWLAFLVVYLSALTACEAITVRVASTGSGNSSCLRDGGICSNLTQVLAFAASYETVDPVLEFAIIINPGSYMLAPSSGTTFNASSDISIIGSEEGAVTIECLEPDAGIAFVSCSNVLISNVTLNGCGMRHLSTSRNFTDSTSLPFNATLYFQQCTNVTLKYVKVKNSTGIGVQFYATTGTNIISNSVFVDNPLHGKSLTRCGGLYIEFPYCLPGSSGLCNSSLPQSSVSDSYYFITHCKFVRNTAQVETEYEHVLPYNDSFVAFGRGGGLSVFFKGAATGNTIDIDNCVFFYNSALFGGGMMVEWEDNSALNNVTISHCQFFNNVAILSGGGSRISFIAYEPVIVNNSIFVLNCTFKDNSADVGGGVSFITTREPNYVNKANDVTFTDCLWEANVARLGAAIDLTVFHSILVGVVDNVTFSRCNYTDNSAMYTGCCGKPLGMGAVYIDSVVVTFDDHILFQSNKDASALTILNTEIYFNEGVQVIFSGNEGKKWRSNCTLWKCCNGG